MAFLQIYQDVRKRRGGNSYEDRTQLTLTAEDFEFLPESTQK